MFGLFKKRQNERLKAGINKYLSSILGTIGHSNYTRYDTKDETYIKDGYLANPSVFAIINQRVQKARSIPFYVKEVADNENFKMVKMLQKSLHDGQRMRIQLEKARAFSETIKSFPLEQPNPDQSWGDIIALYETFMCATGNFYLYMMKGGLGIPVQVYVLPSHMMQIVLKSNAKLLSMESPVEGYVLRNGNKVITFDEDEVIHIKMPNPDFDFEGSHLYGLSPLRAALRNIQSSNEGIDHNVRTMLNSGVIGLISSKGVPLTSEQAAELKSRLQEVRKDSGEMSNLVGVSTEVELTRLSLTTDELQPFAFLKWDEKQISNVLGWDDKLLNNDDGAKYGNVELAEQRVIVSTTMPSLEMFAEAMNKYFLPCFRGYENTVMFFDSSELPEMQIDFKRTVEWVTHMLINGVINRDEARAVLKYPKVGTEEMETFTVANDVMPLNEALNPANFIEDDPTATMVDPSEQISED